MKLPLALFAGSLLFVSAADAGPRRAFQMSTSAHYLSDRPDGLHVPPGRGLAPAARLPRAIRSSRAPSPRAPPPGRSPLERPRLRGPLRRRRHRLAPAPGGPRASRTAVALTTDAGVAEPIAEGGRAVLTTTEGLCGMGVRTGVAIVEPGTYVLRATNVGEGARAAGRGDGRVAARGDGGRGRVVGPDEHRRERGRPALRRRRRRRTGAGVPQRPPRGALGAQRDGGLGGGGSHSARACFSVAQGQGQTVALPTGSLAIVRAWPYGAERGAAVIDLR